MVHISTGAEIFSKVKDFIDHFEEEGTPIMFGYFKKK